MNEQTEKLLKSARSGNKRAGQGDLIKHLTGNRITQRQAIKAKCYDCNGMGEENTCDDTDCSLFPYSPYRKNRGKTQNIACTSGETGKSSEKVMGAV